LLCSKPEKDQNDTDDGVVGSESFSVDGVTGSAVMSSLECHEREIP
jgi:hypothetical protein